MDKLRLDFVHAWRSIRCRPGAAAAAAAVLSLGIGLTATMFALADPFLTKPLPYGRPDEIVVIDLTLERGEALSDVPRLEDWQARDDLFESVAAFRVGTALRLRLKDRAVALQTLEASPTFFGVLRVPGDADGRWQPAGNQAGLPLALTADARHRVFVSSVQIGDALPRLEGGFVQVVSVLPETFVPPHRAAAPRIDAVVPVTVGPLLEETSRSGGATSWRAFRVVARVRPGVTAAAVRAALAARLAGRRGLTVEVESIRSHMTRTVRPVALGAVAAGLLILLVCVGNVSNLLMARAAYRARELATREAIGASRSDVVRLVVIELLLLVAASVAGGLFLAVLALRAAGIAIPQHYMALGTPAVTIRVIMFAAATGGLAMVAAVLPAWTAWHAGPKTVIVPAALPERRAVRMLRFTMAAAQSAMAIVLVAGAALLARSYLNLIAQDTGFAGNVLVVAVSYPPGYSGVRLQRDIEETVQRMRVVDPVIAAGAAIGAMVDGVRRGQLIRVGGNPAFVDLKTVTPDYFAAVGSTIITGRDITADDVNAPSVVVNESFVKRHWPAAPAIGQAVMVGPRMATIVGVVQDSYDIALDTRPEPAMFSLLANPPNGFRVNYAVRLSRRSPGIQGALARQVSRVNPEAIVVEVTSMDERLAGSVRDRTFAALILTLYAVAALGVCIAGLTGLVAFFVVRRTREIAIRLALGAQPNHVRFVVLRETATAAAVGIGAGLLAASWLSRALENFLYGVHAGDWSTLAVAAGVMLAAASVAAWIPVRRATSLSPMTALRVE